MATTSCEHSTQLWAARSNGGQAPGGQEVSAGWGSGMCSKGCRQRGVMLTRCEGVGHKQTNRTSEWGRWCVVLRLWRGKM